MSATTVTKSRTPANLAHKNAEQAQTFWRVSSIFERNFLCRCPAQPAANSGLMVVSAVNECFVPRFDSNTKPGKSSLNTVACCSNRHMLTYNQHQQQPFYGALIQDNPSKPVLSQRRDLLEQPLDFYQPDVLTATQPIMSKHYRKTQWSGCLLF